MHSFCCDGKSDGGISKGNGGIKNKTMVGLESPPIEIVAFALAVYNVLQPANNQPISQLANLADQPS